MTYSLVYRCFRICPDRTKFHTELTFLKSIFRKSDYPDKYIDTCFKKFLDNAILLKKTYQRRKKAFAPSSSVLIFNIFANYDKIQ